MVSWKITPSKVEERNIDYTPFLKCRKFFAVDGSGSTAGAVLRQERAFVDAFQESYQIEADAISLWGWGCDTPTSQFDSVEWRSVYQGTRPSAILRNSAALSTIRKSDVWFLLTDGEIPDKDVHQLSKLAYDSGILNVPLVFLITGSPGSSPGTANISVGISFFASSRDIMILFKDTRTSSIYVIAGKGCFAELGGSAAAQDLASWDDLPVFRSETEFLSHCEKNSIRLVKSETREEDTGGISLGSAWEEQHGGPVSVNLDILLASGFLSDEDAINIFKEDTFGALALACKTRRCISELRIFVCAQKVEQAVPKLEDRNGAAAIITEMGKATTSNENRVYLQEQLRKAHANNRRDYQQMIADSECSVAEQTRRKRNKMVDMALQSLATIETASFRAEIIGRKSNRARRADVIDSAATIDAAMLDLDAPSCKGYCLVCCGEQEIMSICFKETDPESVEDNTTDFALNFPLAAGASVKNTGLISSQNICFQCALFGSQGISVYKERLTAVIPAIEYDGNNKKYINNQLCSALTARLATGTAGVSQLFMSILYHIMQLKSWAGAGLSASEVSADEQYEAAQRRRTFQWMLDQFVQNTYTRKTFNETGAWVKFPEALSWVAKDFKSNKLASFAITYPFAGFNTLLALGRHTGAFSDHIVRQLWSAKMLYSIAAKYLADLNIALQQKSVRTSDNPECWKQKYLEIIYRDFNGSLVPMYHGEASTVADINSFKQRLSVCLAEVSNNHVPGAEIDLVGMHKIQVLLFWLLFTQRNHCTAQTFFVRISQEQHIASAVFSPDLAIPTTSYHEILLSIFATHNAELINPFQATLHNALIPFSNPFGASVLRCGFASCGHNFCDVNTLHSHAITISDVAAIRQARTKHLIEIFGIRGRFEHSGTGLPERFTVGRPPTSIHANFHINIAREWAEQTEDVRRRIVGGGAARANFIESVRRRLCKEGRGDTSNADMERDIQVLLPSFFQTLASALRGEGKSGEDVALYHHDFEKNKLKHKIAYELIREPCRGTSS